MTTKIPLAVVSYPTSTASWQHMSSLTNKRVLLGVTGGIAAYKSAEIIRRLQDSGAIVRVVMTRAATEFITPLTLQALSGNPVHLELLDSEAEAGMGHIELARWADLILVAPATADFIAKLAHGEGGNLLQAICLASNSILALAPAMNQGMWRNDATQQNVETLRNRGVHLFGPAEGGQACGDIGPGRMLEPDEIASLSGQLFATGLLNNRKVVITAGPTREAIDPVRFISNHSSGKMGYALAAAAVEAGASTVLISGPVNLTPPDRVKLISVTSACEMFEVALHEAQNCDLFIASAAVADYRPTSVAEQKLKKKTDNMVLELIKNPDIVSAVANLEHSPFTVGFAAETQDVEKYARDKLTRKKLDMVIANDVSDQTIGFNSNDNAVLVVGPEGAENFPRSSKTTLARRLITMIAGRMKDA